MNLKNILANQCCRVNERGYLSRFPFFEVGSDPKPPFILITFLFGILPAINFCYIGQNMDGWYLRQRERYVRQFVNSVNSWTRGLKKPCQWGTVSVFCLSSDLPPAVFESIFVKLDAQSRFIRHGSVAVFYLDCWLDDIKCSQAV